MKPFVRIALIGLIASMALGVFFLKQHNDELEQKLASSTENTP